MLPPYAEVLGFVQAMAPTWRKEAHATCAELICAVWDRSALCLSELGRAIPPLERPLHGRLKRLGRWLDNPHLDEVGLYARWLRLAYHVGDDVPGQPRPLPLVPLVLDTVYFEPFAVLAATVPCGSRSMPVALTTYHRTGLAACFPPRERWPGPFLADRRRDAPPAAGVPERFWSQNHIEERLLDLVWDLLSPALRGVLVADRGFARASLFEHCRARGRDFVIRIDAGTHVRLPGDLASRPVAQALPVRPGARLWAPDASYQQEAHVPLGLLAVWAPGYKEPWYLGTTLERADWTEQVYAWRMRCEATHRDCKGGLLLRHSGDQHRLTSLPHMHRMVLALALAEWLAALVGWQALADLPRLAAPPAPAAEAMPPAAAPEGDTAALPGDGPAAPPPAVPHRGPRGRTPPWLRRFVGRGPLSPARLGWEVLQAPDLRAIAQRLLRWLDFWLGGLAPVWSAAQRRYRRRHWWPDARAA